MFGAVAGAAAATPVADGVLLNPLAVPPGVAIWLREWERRLRHALRAIDEADTPPSRVPAWDDAVAELRAIDPDAKAGVFRLLLVRPLWQLEEGSAARETFDRCATTVLDRIDAARALVREIVPLAAERERLLDEFGHRFPNRLAEQLERVRARESDIARLRRASDAGRMRTRLMRARRALEGITHLIEGETTDSLAGDVLPGESETLAELVAAHAQAARARRQLELHSAMLGEHRGHLAAQLRGLALSAPGGMTPTNDGARRAGQTAIVLERLVNAAAAAGERAREGRDAPLWTGVLSAAVAAHHPGLDRLTWLPALLASERMTDDDGVPALPEADLLHAVPIGSGLVYLSPRGDSAVRVHTRSVRLGDAVTLQVAPDMVPRHPPALVDADVAALFDGHDAERSRWYRTAKRASVRVVARYASGWFARLERRGSLSVTDQPAWQPHAAGAAFRLLRPAGPIALGAPSDEAGGVELVAAVHDAAHATFLGFTLHEVRTSLLGDERAWMRGVTNSWPGAMDAVRREAELFDALRAQHAGAGTDLTLRPLGWARTADAGSAWPLFRPPIATLESPKRLRAWLAERDEHLLAVIADVARIMTAAHACGFALGVCHSEAFAFGVRWSPDPLTPMPTPMLAHAPAATRFGKRFAPPGAAGLSPAYYTMLRTPVLVPEVAGAQVATRERDMQGFGAFVLDLLLEHPVFERGTLDWFDAAGVVRARASQCSAHPTVAKHLSDQLQTALGWRRIEDMVARLAAGRVTRIAELL